MTRDLVDAELDKIRLAIELYGLFEYEEDCRNLKKAIAVDVLCPLLKHSYELVRVEAINAFLDIECDWYREDIQNILVTDPSSLVRVTAADILGYVEVSHQYSVPYLEKALLEDVDKVVKGYAAYSLASWVTEDYLSKFDEYLSMNFPLFVQINLLAARYFVGKNKADMEKVLEIFSNADEEHATVIHNILKDLAEREGSSLLLDFPNFWDTLSTCPHTL